VYRLLLFLRRIYLLVIFLALEGLVLGYYARQTAHSRARLLSLSDTAVGGVVSAAERFFTLGATNRMLESRVEELENELTLWRRGLAEARLDSMTALMGGLRGEVVAARVVRNSVSRAENYFTVDRGARDGVERGMAAVTVDGCVAGSVVGVSGGNALCMSVLNTDFRASGMFPASGHFGSVSWLGTDKRRVRLTEVPKYAGVARGDTVVTRSSINFPEGLMVGTVEEFSVDEARASYDIDVRLGADMAALRVVMLVRNPEAGERLRLEEDVLGTASADGE
jgi:rod shape-determining protein MreC